MEAFTKLNCFIYCILIFLISRLVMLYQYDLATHVFLHHHFTFFQMMCRWDCKWYLTIIHHGYDYHLRQEPLAWRGLANWAFFPLYPLIIKIVVYFSHKNPLIVGILLNQGFVFLALIVFYYYLRLLLDDLNSRFGVFLLAFSPFSIYFASLYTEALFLLLSLLAFYTLRSGKLWLSALFGGLLAATRPVGMMFAFSYCYTNLSKLKLKIILPLFICLSGIIIYSCYLYLHVGDFLAFFHVQHGWGRNGLNFAHLPKQLYLMLLDYHNSCFFLLSLALTIYLGIKKYIAEAIFNLFCILPGVLTGTMISEARFSATLFTFYFALTLFVRNSMTGKVILIIIFLLLYISYFLYWMVAPAKFLI